MGLDQLVNLSITTATKTPSKRGFGTPLIVAYHNAWADLSREYSQPSEMLSDGFTANDWAYRAAVTVKSQNPAPKTFKVGRRTTAPDRTVRWTPLNTTEDYVYSFNVVNPSGTSTAISYTVPSSATVASICTAVQALVNAISGIDCSDDTTHISITATTPGDDFRITGMPTATHATLEDVTAAPGTLATELTNIANEDGDFYGVCIDSTGHAENAATAAWAEARKIIFIPVTVDSEVGDSGVTDCTMSTLQASSYARSGPWYHHEFGSTLGAGLLGVMLPTTPGSATWAFKTIAGVEVSPLSVAQTNAIEAKGGNHYHSVGGIGITFPGYSSSGEYFDVTRLVDWTYARIQERILFLLANQKKVPFTNAGAAMVQGEVGGVLQQGVDNGGYAKDPPFTVTAPDVNDVSASDRASRNLPSVEFTARLAGAIHTLDITGVVSA